MLKQETRSTGASLRLGGTPSVIPKVKNCGGTAKNMRKSSMKVSDLANVFPRTIDLEVVMSLAQEIWSYYGFFRYPGIYPNRRSFRNRISPPPKKNIQWMQCQQLTCEKNNSNTSYGLLEIHSECLNCPPTENRCYVRLITYIGCVRWLTTAFFEWLTFKLVSSWLPCGSHGWQ